MDGRLVFSGGGGLVIQRVGPGYVGVGVGVGVGVSVGDGL